MDLLTFISTLIDSLAWPLAAVTLGLVFRRQVTLLLPFVRRVKAGPLEAEFEREVRELRTTADSAASQNPASKPAWQDGVEQLAQVNPRSAIMEAWRQTEATLVRAIQSHDSSLSERDLRSTREVLRILGEHGMATPEEAAMLNQMRFLRNQAAHVDASSQVTTQQ